jgi:hypothetical protein
MSCEHFFVHHVQLVKLAASTFRPFTMSNAITEQPALAHRGTMDSGSMDEKRFYTDDKPSPPGYADEKGHVDVKHLDATDIGDIADDVRAIDLGADGKERPIDTAEDYALRLISLEDDPTQPVFTFRMWFLALGLSCFGAVLGQLFYFRPQTINVSQLFIQVWLSPYFSVVQELMLRLQIIAYILGKALEQVIPGSGSVGRLKTRDSWFWRFMNPGPFNIKEHVAIVIMAATASDSAMAISIFAAQDLYYNVKPNAGIGIMTLVPVFSSVNTLTYIFITDFSRRNSLAMALSASCGTSWYTQPLPYIRTSCHRSSCTTPFTVRKKTPYKRSVSRSSGSSSSVSSYGSGSRSTSHRT